MVRSAHMVSMDTATDRSVTVAIYHRGDSPIRYSEAVHCGIAAVVQAIWASRVDALAEQFWIDWVIAGAQVRVGQGIKPKLKQDVIASAGYSGAFRGLSSEPLPVTDDGLAYPLFTPEPSITVGIPEGLSVEEAIVAGAKQVAKVKFYDLPDETPLVHVVPSDDVAYATGPVVMTFWNVA